MLVLTRRVGQVLIINDNIEVTILRVQGRQVKFGITAPKDVPVHRLEIHQKILLEKALKESLKEEAREGKNNE